MARKICDRFRVVDGWSAQSSRRGGVPRGFESVPDRQRAGEAGSLVGLLDSKLFVFEKRREARRGRVIYARQGQVIHRDFSEM